MPNSKLDQHIQTSSPCAAWSTLWKNRPSSLVACSTLGGTNGDVLKLMLAFTLCPMRNLDRLSSCVPKDCAQLAILEGGLSKTHDATCVNHPAINEVVLEGT
jgi:hypothetical protein